MSRWASRSRRTRCCSWSSPLRQRATPARPAANRTNGRPVVPVDMDALCTDLELETRSLDGLLAGLASPDWERPTPSVGWLVRDQVSHLAHFDEVTVEAAREPDRFRSERDQVTDIEGLTARVA